MLVLPPERIEPTESVRGISFRNLGTYQVQIILYQIVFERSNWKRAISQPGNEVVLDVFFPSRLHIRSFQKILNESSTDGLVTSQNEFPTRHKWKEDLTVQRVACMWNGSD